MEKERITILIITNSDELLSNAPIELSHDIVTLAILQDKEEVIQFCHHLPPDILLIDLETPDLNIVELVHEIDEYFPKIQMIGIINSGDKELIQTFLEAGAVGCILKEELNKNLSQLIRSAYAGNFVFSPKVTKLLLSS